MTVSVRTYDGVKYVYMTYRDQEKRVRTNRRKMPIDHTEGDLQKAVEEMKQLEKSKAEEMLCSYIDNFWWKNHPKYLYLSVNIEGTSPYAIRAAIGNKNISRVFGITKTFSEAFDEVWRWLVLQLGFKDIVHRDVCKAISKIYMRDKYIELHNSLQKQKAT